MARYTFWTAWTVAALVAAVVLYFFAIGLADGSVSSFNMGIWMALLTSAGVVVEGSLKLHGSGHRMAAIALALVLAVPDCLAGVFILLVLATNPRWN